MNDENTDNTIEYLSKEHKEVLLEWYEEQIEIRERESKNDDK